LEFFELTIEREEVVLFLAEKFDAVQSVRSCIIPARLGDVRILFGVELFKNPRPKHELIHSFSVGSPMVFCPPCRVASTGVLSSITGVWKSGWKPANEH
jgi:hypothetical protein